MLGKLSGLDTVLVAIGSLLPDADCRNSYVGRFLPMWLFTKHRGFLHTIDVALILMVISFPLGLGYLSHLALDRHLKFSKFTHRFMEYIKPS